MRGKHSALSRKEIGIRITPAGAGKTLPTTIYSIATKDHPRRCGENLSKKIRKTKQLGSPPQVRGKPAVVKQAAAIAWDHPRRCGENRIGVSPLVIMAGSPPQVRGKH